MKKEVPWYRRVYSAYMRSSTSRKTSFNLSERQVADLIYGDCYYCGIAPNRMVVVKNGAFSTKKFFRHGIDRLDSKRGYELDNCVSCCTACNRMKMDQTPEEFFGRVARIYHLHIAGDKNANAG